LLYKRFYFVFLVIISTSFYSLLIGCSSESPLSPGITGSVKFSRDIQPIFTQNCTLSGCHNPIDKASGIDLTTWGAIMKNGSNFGAEVIPFNSKWSHLVQHINNDTNVAPVAEPHMPPFRPPVSNGRPLPQNVVILIMKWIDEGARNDNGEIAYSNITNKAFVTNQASDYIAVVNLDNNFLTRLIKTGNSSSTSLAAPHVVIVDDQGINFYVSLIREGFIEKFNAMTYEKTGRLNAGIQPAHIVITGDGRYGYFSNFDVSASNPEKYIKKFDTQSMTVIDTISEFRMKAPHGLRLTHDGNLLIAATEVSEYIYIIRTSDDFIEDIIPVDNIVPPNGNGTNQFVPYQIAITPDDRYAFISCLKSNDVRVLDIQNRILLSSYITVELNPLALEISPDGRWCYVPNRNSNSLTVIDVQSRTIVKTIPGVGVQPHKVDFTADGHFAYVTCESQSGSFIHHPAAGSNKPGTTAVIDVWNGHVKIHDIEMASYPAGISITPGKGN
jgi:YVTN family beta-propeller protein